MNEHAACHLAGERESAEHESDAFGLQVARWVQTRLSPPVHLHSIGEHYTIYIPGSLHYLLLGIFCRFKTVSLDIDNCTVTRSNTETVSFFVDASPHKSASVAEESPQQIYRNGFVLTTLHCGGGSFSKTKLYDLTKT